MIGISRGPAVCYCLSATRYITLSLSLPLLPHPSAEGRTPLHLAALGGHAEAATLLLQKGAWAEAEDAGDDTPLHLAARWVGGVAGVELLGEGGMEAEGCGGRSAEP